MRVAILYQSIPPYYIRDRLQYDTPEIREFYYMIAHLETQGTPIEDWSVQLVQATLDVE